MSRVIKLGQVRTSDISAGYIAFYPCFQANTDTSLTDRSGQGNTGTFNSLTTGEAWTASNCLSNPTTASHHVTLAKTAITTKGWQWNASRKDTLLISFKCKITLPAANNPFMGNANSTSEGGLKFLVDNTAKLQFAFYDKVNTASQFSSQSSAIDASWASNYHTVCLFMDGPNNTYTVYVDGLAILGPVSLSSVTVLEPQSSTFDWTVNGASQLSQVTGTAMAMFGFHMIAAPQSYGAIVRPDNLAMRLHRNPVLPITKTEWPY